MRISKNEIGGVFRPYIKRSLYYVSQVLNWLVYPLSAMYLYVSLLDYVHIVGWNHTIMKPSFRKYFWGKVENNYYLGLKDTTEEKTCIVYGKTSFLIVFAGKLNKYYIRLLASMLGLKLTAWVSCSVALIYIEVFPTTFLMFGPTHMTHLSI